MNILDDVHCFCVRALVSKFSWLYESMSAGIIINIERISQGTLHGETKRKTAKIWNTKQ